MPDFYLKTPLDECVLPQDQFGTLIADRVTLQFDHTPFWDPYSWPPLGNRPEDFLEILYNRNLDDEQKQCFASGLLELLLNTDAHLYPHELMGYLHLVECLGIHPPKEWMDMMKDDVDLKYLPTAARTYIDPTLGRREVPEEPYYAPNLRAHLLRVYTGLEPQAEDPAFWIHLIESEPDCAMIGFTGLRRCDASQALEYIPRLVELCSNPDYPDLTAEELIGTVMINAVNKI